MAYVVIGTGEEDEVVVVVLLSISGCPAGAFARTYVVDVVVEVVVDVVLLPSISPGSQWANTSCLCLHHSLIKETHVVVVVVVGQPGGAP